MSSSKLNSEDSRSKFLVHKADEVSTSISFGATSGSSSGAVELAGCLSLAWNFLDFSLYASAWAFNLARHLNAVAWCFAPQFAHLGVT